MVRTRIACLIVFAVVFVAALPGICNTWDVSADWSSINNPAGTWSYGWNDSSTSFTTFIRDQWPPASSSRWCGGTLAAPDRGAFGTVTKNQSTGRVTLTDSPTRNTIVRWTSPYAGTIHIMARLSSDLVVGPYAPYPYCVVSVYQNSTQKFTTNMRSYLGSYSYSGDLAVSVGDTVDLTFTEDPGNGVVQQHSAFLWETITSDPVGTVSGTVRSNAPGNPPIASAVIQTPDTKFVTKTAPDGSYSLTVPQGTYTFSVSATGHIGQQATSVAVPGGGAVTRDFVLSGGGINGAVTAADAGSPVAGATVRTEGEPSYSAITAGDGTYSINAPGGVYNLVISAAGYNPAKSAVTVTEGFATTRNIALNHQSAGLVVSLPPPLDSGTPAGAPLAPGDSFPIAFANTAAVPNPSTPQICGWNETVKTDESFTMTGIRFTARSGPDAGTDTIVWVWARTWASGGVLRQAKLWKVSETTIVALLPDQLPFGPYMVWVENANGPGAPIILNKPLVSWVGPLGNAVQAGTTKRIFGRNMSYGHGTTTSFVYIQPASGGTLTACNVTKADPFSAQFTVPAGTPNGNYKAYVHNGQGGVYGWSDAIDIVVQDAWARGPAEVALTPTGSDDALAIQGAINTLAALPTGGTVRLSSGTFKTYAGLVLKSNVRIVGAGMNQTTIQLRETVQTHDYIHVEGVHMGIESLTLNACLDTPMTPGYGIIGGPYPNTSEAVDIKYLNMRMTGDFGTLLMGNGMGYSQVEIGGCEFYRGIGPGSVDGWLHDTNLYGGPYGIYSPVYVGETEAAAYPGEKTVYENCHIETQNWPVNPSTGSRNYYDWYMDVYGSWDAIGYKPWAKRVALMGGGYHYCANLTTKDVAVQDNRGEMFLYHGAGGAWFGNVVASNGLTMTLRTDGLVDDQAISVGNYGVGIAGGQTVTDAVPWYSPITGKWIVIVAGRGLGQTRRLVTYTENSFTVDKPWAIQPDATSKIMLTPLYIDSTIYNNDLNAFPVGYVQTYDASRGADIDGNGWRITIEGNTSRRTNIARDIHSNSCGPSYWNVARDEKAYDCWYGGYAIYYWDASPIGPTLLGNAFRNCLATVVGPTNGATQMGYGEGTIFENMVLTGKLGYSLAGVAGPPSYSPVPPWPDGSSLYRNGSVTITDPPDATNPSAPEAVYITATDGKQYLVNNSYSGGAPTYTLNTGLSSYSIPVTQYRVAKFTGYAGYPVQSQILPIANAGIASMNWTVTPGDSWITASIQSNGNLAAESTLGRLIVSVDTTGMPAGRRWGSVTVNTGAQSVKMGVCVDLTSGTPTNSLPTASFSATPSVGVTPLSVTFNAAASSDTDGAVASYSWDYGDGTYGSGVTSTHVYAVPNTYTPVLTITDNAGGTGSSWTNVTTSPALASVTLAGSPVGAIPTSTPVTLTATAAGGYLVQYKFLIKDSNGWNTLRDWGNNTCNWTPSVAGYYELKVYARNTGSTNVYDAVSSILSYPVGLLPTGMKLWLKADAGVVVSAGAVSNWADQSGANNNVSQTNNPYRPAMVDNVINGRPVVRFTGPSQILQANGLVLNADTSFTAFTLGRFNSIPGTNYQYLWWNGAESIPGGYGCYINTSSQIRSGWGGNDHAPRLLTPATVGTLYEITSRFTSSGGTGPNEMWVNGGFVQSLTKSGSSLSGGTFSIGNYGPSPGQGFYGDIAEILIYDRALTDTEKSNVETYLTSRWVATPPLTKDRLKDVKALGDSVLVTLTTAKVATTDSGLYSDGGVYVSESDRTCGLKVLGAGTVATGDNLTLTGITGTDTATGERTFTVTSIGAGANTPLGPLGMLNKAVTASGQLVTVWGKVTAKTLSYITLDDGSGASVKVQIDGLVTPITAPNIGDYISATGPAGLMAGGVPSVRVRAATDIQKY